MWGLGRGVLGVGCWVLGVGCGVWGVGWSVGCGFHGLGGAGVSSGLEGFELVGKESSGCKVQGCAFRVECEIECWGSGARIQGSHTCVSLNSKLESKTGEEKVEGAHPTRVWRSTRFSERLTKPDLPRGLGARTQARREKERGDRARTAALYAPSAGVVF